MIRRRHRAIFFLAAVLFTAGHAAASPLTALRHENDELGTALTSLDACIRSMPGPPWRHHPYRRGGNFFTARWCRGKGVRDDCQIADGSGHRPDQHVLSLFTLFYPQRFPQVFGLGLEALVTPPGPGWGARLHLAVEGKRVVGDSLALDFSRYEAESGPPAVTLHLGTSLVYRIHSAELRVDTGASPVVLLGRYTDSATALRDAGLDAYSELGRRTLAALDAGAVRACDYGPYKGDGVAPECRERPLTAAESEAAAVEAGQYFAGVARLLGAEYRAMHDALAVALPATCVWP